MQVYILTVMAADHYHCLMLMIAHIEVDPIPDTVSQPL